MTNLFPQWRPTGVELVQLLAKQFGADQVLVRSPHHVQVKLDSQTHNLWIDSACTVKYKLAGQAGRAVVAETSDDLLAALGRHQPEKTDWQDMRQALELSELVDSARSAIPLTGLKKAVFVDAGFKEGKAQIGVVEVVLKGDGEHVRAESHPIVAKGNTQAESAAIEFALEWCSPQTTIFCDNKSAVQQFQDEHGDRVQWLSRQLNKAADRVANMRGPKKKSKNRKAKNRRRRQRAKKKKKKKDEG